MGTEEPDSIIRRATRPVRASEYLKYALQHTDVAWRREGSIGLGLAVAAGVAEYFMTGGISGWVPLLAGAVGVLVVLAVQVLVRSFLAPADKAREDVQYLQGAYERLQEERTGAKARIKELEAAIAPPIRVVGVRGSLAEDGSFSAISVAIANYESSMPVSVDVAVSVHTDDLEIDLPGPWKEDIPPGGTPVVVPFPVKIPPSDSLVVFGVVTYGKRKVPYCYKYWEWPGKGRPTEAQQFIHCDTKTQRHITAHMNVPCDWVSGASATLGKLNQDGELIEPDAENG